MKTSYVHITRRGFALRTAQRALIHRHFQHDDPLCVVPVESDTDLIVISAGKREFDLWAGHLAITDGAVPFGRICWVGRKVQIKSVERYDSRSGRFRSTRFYPIQSLKKVS